MKVLLFTSPERIVHEHEIVESMFAMGLCRLHLRKPTWSEAEMVDWLDAINPMWLSRIVLHDYHQLASRYPVGGVHLNSRNPELLPSLIPMHQSGQLTVSRSCHSIAELAEESVKCDYMTLSPIFDSISKQGYGAAFSREELLRAGSDGWIDENVYALGGVSLARRNELEQLGFSAAALLGEIWQAPNPIEALAPWL